jgi:hypothetical protein
MKENSSNLEVTESHANNSSIKPILNNYEDKVNDYNQSTASKGKPTYSQKRGVKKQNYIIKKNVKFKTNYKEVIDVESYKHYNLKMCYEEIDLSNGVPIKKSCCEDSECLIL